MLARSLVSAFALALAVPTSFVGSKSKEADSLIARAKQLTDIRAESSPSFVLKAEFKILRDPDHPVTGTYKETWVSRSLVRTEISAGEYRRTEIINGRKRWELDSTQEVPKDVNSAAITVGYRLDFLSLDSRGVEKTIDRTSGSWLLRCLVGRDDGFGGKAEYCFEKSGGELVSESIPFLSQGGEKVNKCAVTDFQKLGDKLFPRSVRCVGGDGETIDGRVVQLTFEELNDKSVFDAPPGAKEFPNCPVLPENTQKPPKCPMQLEPLRASR